MEIAQRLYEAGQITYHRTDGVDVAPEAQRAALQYIARTFGGDYVPNQPHSYQAKAKHAQEAHEAIRPTDVTREPDAVEGDGAALYRLIWQRFVASQMAPSVSDVTTVEIEATRAGSADVAGVRASGSVLKDPGWLRVYGQVAEGEEAEGEGNGDAEEGKVRLPQLAEGDLVRLAEGQVEDHETQPPPRFNEASLVKFLEENGIGRPSTYAEILRKIEDREYVRKKDRRFLPTLLGRLVIDLMREGFDDFFQTESTARMEEELDEVEEGKLDWRKAVGEFDARFTKDRDRALKKMISVKAGLALAEVKKRLPGFPLPEGVGEKCPKSGDELRLRMGKNGLFVACAGYPGCDYTVDVPEPEDDPVDASELEGQTCDECGSPMKLRTGRDGSAFLGCTAYPNCRFTVAVKVANGKAEARPDVPTGEKCPLCGHDLVARHGRFGDYVGCSNYPACRYRPPKPVTSTNVACPDCGTGEVLVRKGRFGPFYGCSNYPTCTRNFRARPVPKACPACGAPYLLVRDRKAGAFYVCEKEGCGFDAPAQDLDAWAFVTKVPEAAAVAAAAAAAAAEKKKPAAKRARKG